MKQLDEVESVGYRMDGQLNARLDAERLLGGLNPMLREAVEGRYLLGLGQNEAAELGELTVQTARVRVHRGLKAMRAAA